MLEKGIWTLIIVFFLNTLTACLYLSGLLAGSLTVVILLVSIALGLLIVLKP